MNAVTRMALGAVLAAGAMYFFDPVSGRRRRLLVEDQCARTARRLELGTRDARHELSNRVHDFAVKAHLAREEVSDKTLHKNVQQVIRRSVAHPKAISCKVKEGNVFLRGDVLTLEHQQLLDEARAVEGVRIITDHLTEREPAEGVRPFQDGATGDAWSVAGRVFVGATGCALLVWGIKERKALVSTGQSIWRKAEEALENLESADTQESERRVRDVLDATNDIAEGVPARGRKVQSAARDAVRAQTPVQ